MNISPIKQDLKDPNNPMTSMEVTQEERAHIEAIRKEKERFNNLKIPTGAPDPNNPLGGSVEQLKDQAKARVDSGLSEPK